MDPSAILLLVETLVSGASSILQAVKNKSAAEAGTILATTSQVVMAVLQQNAAISGITIDWTDPAAVGAYVLTLPQFVPIPDPAAPAAPATQPAAAS
jgi:hypothetical protein